MHDAESAISVTALPHISEGSHVKETKTPSDHTAVSLLAAYPITQATMHDAVSAISVTALPHTSAGA